MNLATRILSLIFVLQSLSANSQTIIDTLILIDSITIGYKVDEYKLNKANQKFISNFVPNLDSSYFEYHIDSHTDSDGSDNYNVKLSKKRSDEISLYLLKLGISPDRIISNYHGETQLISTESNDNTKAKNRRTTLILFQRGDFVLFDGKIVDKESSLIPNSKISIFHDGVVRNVEVDSNRMFSIPLPIGRKVELHFQAVKYFPLIKILNITKKTKAKSLRIPLVKMELNAQVKTKINFEGNKSIILNSSINELETLLSTLKKNNEICTEFQGHINYPNRPEVKRGSHKYGLSIARSHEVYSYMVKNGISKDRILVRGYGSSKMIYPKTTSEKFMKENRRVEIKVISCDSTKMKKNDTIENYKDYKRHGMPMNRIFNIERINEDLPYLKIKTKREIIEQARYLESKGIDPSKLSYKELLIQYAERKLKKN